MKKVDVKFNELLITNAEKLIRGKDYQIQLLNEKIELLEKIINVLKS